jgi:hypothetical protein
MHDVDGSDSCAKLCTSNQLLPCNPNVSMLDIKNRPSVDRAACTTCKLRIQDHDVGEHLRTALLGRPGVTLAKSNGRFWREHLHCYRVAAFVLSPVLPFSC